MFFAVSSRVHRKTRFLVPTASVHVPHGSIGFKVVCLVKVNARNSRFGKTDHRLTIKPLGRRLNCGADRLNGRSGQNALRSVGKGRDAVFFKDRNRGGKALFRHDHRNLPESVAIFKNKPPYLRCRKLAFGVFNGCSHQSYGTVGRGVFRLRAVIKNRFFQKRQI